MVGKTVRIIKGPYKGHIGMVKDATPNDCRVELHSNVFKIINFKVFINIIVCGTAITRCMVPFLPIVEFFCNFGGCESISGVSS